MIVYVDAVLWMWMLKLLQLLLLMMLLLLLLLEMIGAIESSLVTAGLGM